MKHFLFILCTALMLVSCDRRDDPIIKPGIEQEPDAEQSPLTVMVYLVADTNIKSDLRNNVMYMYRGLSQIEKKATLLVYWDGGGSDEYFETSPCIVRYETDGKGNINGIPSRDSLYTMRQVAEYGEIVKEYHSMLSTDKSTMTTILKHMAELSPTKELGLIAGSHGSAWLKSIYGYKARAFGQDGNGDITITTGDMAQAIRDAGIHLDFLLYDACMMGTVEVCYDFKDVVDYMIVSALDVPAYGFPYQDMLQYLYEPEVSNYTKACDEYIEYYRGFSTGWGTIALVDNHEMRNLADEVKNELLLHADMIADYNPIGKLQHYGLNTSATGFKYVSFDMGQFISILNEGVIPDAFQTQMEKTIIHKNCLEKTTYYRIDASKFCGLGMYIPLESRPVWNEHFETLSWYKAAGWDEIFFSWQ